MVLLTALSMTNKKKDYWRNFGKVKNTTYAPSLSWENDKTKVLLSYEHKDIL